MRVIPKITVKVLLPLRCGLTNNAWRQGGVVLTWNRLNSSSSDPRRQKIVVPIPPATIGSSRTGNVFPKVEPLPKADIGGAFKLLSKNIDPYVRLMRLDKPIGAWLLFWPCSWSIMLAANPALVASGDVVKTLGLFLAGSFVMRGAGCTINDMWDRDIDRKVERTKVRPLASNEVSMKHATIFLAGQLSLGLGILLQLNWYSVLLGASSMGLVITYPLAKRVTNYPQLVLGLTFNWGALLGYSAITGSMDPTICLPLYASSVCWTLLYDTIYAHQDKDDDALIGIKSTALTFKKHTKPWLWANGAGVLAGLTSVGIMADLNWPYYGALSLVAAHISRQIWTLDPDNKKDCSAKFTSNSSVGLLILLGIVFGKWDDVRKFLGLNKKDKNDILKLSLLQ